MTTMIGRRVWCSVIGMHKATVVRATMDGGAWEVELDGWGKHYCGAYSLHLTDADAMRYLEEGESVARHTREQIERGEESIDNE